jgi:sulfur-carrier protein adenylyltransferase/sulfurtransferase
VSPLEQILDLARWAPSGDNTQPWRFEIVADDAVVIHGFDTRQDCLYDIDGRPSQIAIGALLETLRIAATKFGLRVVVQRLPTPDAQPTFNVKLVADPEITASRLAPFITVRSVQRRALKTRLLSARDKAELEASIGTAYKVVWIEGWKRRFAVARLLFASAKIRLTTPEAFEVHRRVIEWNTRFSSDKIPDQALGADPMTTRLMRWAMRDWRRIEFLNTYLAGTLVPRVQLDFIPGFACAAHFVITANSPLEQSDDYIDAGAAMQRFWLTATLLGLQLQPEMTPLIFSMYARAGRRFSSREASFTMAKKVREALETLVGEKNLEAASFMGRIGGGRPAMSRSTRLPLDRLLVR